MLDPQDFPEVAQCAGIDYPPCDPTGENGAPCRDMAAHYRDDLKEYFCDHHYRQQKGCVA